METFSGRLTQESVVFVKGTRQWPEGGTVVGALAPERGIRSQLFALSSQDDAGLTPKGVKHL